MRKRFWGIALMGTLLLFAMSASALVAQKTKNRPATAPAPANDLKIKYRMTMAGQAIENTTMIKGARERSEMRMGHGMDTVNLTQCDLKRTIQFSDKTRKYIITPMSMDSSAAPSPAGPATTSASEPVRRGGVITYVTTATDTGERKEMFGFTARHVKTTMSMESSPDACNQVKQRIETDGWYIDLSFGLDCNLGQQMAASAAVPQGGCQDRISFKHVGAARTGYPLSETTTMYGPDGKVMITSAKEIAELSRDPLDATLFDVPAGYTETRNHQELYAPPSMDSMASQAANTQPSGENSPSDTSNTGEAKASGIIRVGVVRINNKSGRAVSIESLRGRLVGEIQGNGVEAIALNASSPAEAEAEAKARQCDFILYTDINALKTSTAKKIGGMFGRAAGVSGADKTESTVEFKLFAVNETSPRLQTAVTAKEEGEEASAGAAIAEEARKVSAEVRKKRS